MEVKHMDQIRVIGDADTLRWLRRWVTNEHQASVRLLNVTTAGPSANLANGQKPMSQPEAAELKPKLRLRDASSHRARFVRQGCEADRPA
jgi:hypothetical protein